MRLRLWLEDIVSKINSNPQAQLWLREWIGSYYGKILGFGTQEECYTLILTPGRVRLLEKEYPSCECVLVGDEPSWERIISSKCSYELVKQLMKSGDIWVKGNLNEIYNFSRLLNMI